MNSTKIAVVLAMLVGVALCSPCTDTCNSACSGAKTVCDASVVLGPLCVVQFGVCSQGCAAICGCQDGCAAQCEPAFTDCTTNAHSMLQKGQCIVENDVCVVDCEGLCSAQQANQAVSGAIASLPGMLQ